MGRPSCQELRTDIQGLKQKLSWNEADWVMMLFDKFSRLSGLR